MDKTDGQDLERRMVVEWSRQIDSLERQIAAAQAQLHALKVKRAAVTGEGVTGVTATGLSVIAANNTLIRLKRTKADKSDIAKAQKTVDDLRAKLTQEKAARKGGKQ